MSTSIPSITSPHRRTNSKSISPQRPLSFETSSIPSYGRDLIKPSNQIPREQANIRENSNIKSWTFPRVTKNSQTTVREVDESNYYNEGDGGYDKSNISYGNEFRTSSSSSGKSVGLSSSSSSHPKIHEDSTNSSLSSTPSPSPQSKIYRRPSISFAYSGAPSANTNPNSSFPKTPSALVKLFYSNLRRRSLIDLLYGFIFMSSVLVFFGALTGSGYNPTLIPLTPNTTHSNNSTLPSLSQPNLSRSITSPVSSIPINQPSISQDLAQVISDKVETPADVHQPEGDTSHDTSPEFLKDSPDDPRLSDEHTHHYHANEDNLFNEDVVKEGEIVKVEGEEQINNGEKIFLATEEGIFEEDKDIVSSSIVAEIVSEAMVDKVSEVKKPRSILRIIEDEEEFIPVTFRLAVPDSPAPQLSPSTLPLSPSDIIKDTELPNNVPPSIPAESENIDSDVEEEENRLKLREEQILGDSFRSPSGPDSHDDLKRSREGLRMLSKKRM